MVVFQGQVRSTSPTCFVHRPCLQWTLFITRKLQSMRASKVSFENKIHSLELPLSLESSDGRDPSRARLGLPTCQDGDVALIKERLTLDHPNAIRQCRSWTERSSQIRYCRDGQSVRLQTTGQHTDQTSEESVMHRSNALPSGGYAFFSPGEPFVCRRILLADCGDEFREAGDLHIGSTVSRFDGSDTWA